MMAKVHTSILYLKTSVCYVNIKGNGYNEVSNKHILQQRHIYIKRVSGYYDDIAKKKVHTDRRREATTDGTVSHMSRVPMRCIHPSLYKKQE